MDAKRFILTLLAVAVVGAGAGYGASVLFPAPAAGEEAPPEPIETGAGVPEPDAGAAGGPAADQPSVDDLLAAMPEEMRRQMEDDPQLAAQVRAQLQQAIDSGQLPPGAFGAAPDGGVPATDALGGGARNAEPLTGEVLSFEEGTLRLNTPDGEAEAAVAPDTPVTVVKPAGEAVDALTPGAEVAVIARRDESGALTAALITSGGAGEGALGAVGRRAGGLAAVLTGTVESFADSVLTVETADGPVEVAASDETPVQITATAETAADELAAGVTATAFVQRGADGSLVAVSIAVGATGRGLGGGLFGGAAGQGGGQGGG